MWEIKSKNTVEIANTVVSIDVVLKLVGIDAVENYKGKIQCPLGEIYHSDGGTEATMRVYADTNSAYCFRCVASFTPVWLYAQINGVKPREAADFLLEYVGHTQPSPVDLWAKYNNPEDVMPDTASLAAALKIYCSRLPCNWKLRQFDVDVSATLSKCLDLLEFVQSTQQAEQWLLKTKAVMRRVLEG